MGRVRVAGFGVSLDGFGAGPEQSLEGPLGKRGTELHGWFFGTKTFKALFGDGGGSEGVDEDYAHRSMTASAPSSSGGTCSGRCAASGRTTAGRVGGATIRRITHRMEGGTTFYFVTDGIHAALERARDAAGDLDIKIGGGVSTVRQYLQAGLIDELHFAFSPVMLGRSEAMFQGLRDLYAG